MTHALPLTLADGERTINIRAVDKRYGRRPALQALNLQVPVGAFYLLVGPNGAGKSTVFKLLLDLVRATAGVAEVFGLDVQRLGPSIRANIGYVPERSEWAYGWMTVGRLLAHHAQYFPRWDTAYATHLCRAFDIEGDQRVGTLSKGQTRRAHFVMALAHRPPLLLLDEPLDGLDPVMRDEALGILANHLAETETTVLLSTHHIAEVEQFADHVGVLRGGTLRAQLPLAELYRNLHRYRTEFSQRPPEGFTFDGAVLRHSAPGLEMEWTIWGSEERVTAELMSAGATVHGVLPLSLDEAALVLLTTNG